MSFGNAPEPILRVTVGSPIFTRDDQKIGVVKEIRGRAFKVGAGFWREFWLGAESLAAAVPDQSVTLVVDKARLSVLQGEGAPGRSLSGWVAARDDRMKRTSLGPFLVAFFVAMTACAQPSGGDGQAPSGQSSATGPARTLVSVVRVEPPSVAGKPLLEAGVALYWSRRLFNADLAILDDQGIARPYLADSLPQLDTNSWRVFPDGRMETLYHLKPNLLWHDGAPLRAEDFVFSWQVYSSPELGLARSLPWNAVEQVVAPDPRTILVRWRQPYPDAGTLTKPAREFPPLPRHILESPFVEGEMEAFANHPYWTREFVGLGPYRLNRWEPGTFIEGTAFEGHILGAPKIPRVKLIFSSDANTTLATLLAGEIQLATDGALRLEHAATVKQEWGPRNAGDVLIHPNQWRSTYFQFRPELVSPRALLDGRVRRALAHAVDREGINQALYQGLAVPAHTMIPPNAEFGAAIDRAITKYAFDPRLSEQSMQEAGFAKGADGFYAGPGEGRFSVEAKTNSGQDNESENSILASGWRQAGFDINEVILPAAQARDNQVRASFPGLFTNNTGVGEAAMLNQTSARIPRPDNRWVGGNRGGWSNVEFDRLARVFSTTLDPAQRTEQIVQIMRIYSDEVPAIPLFFRGQPWAHVVGLTGLRVVPSDANMSWNVHEWELR